MRTYRLIPLLALFGGLLMTSCHEDDGNGTDTPSAVKNINANPTTRPELARLEVPRLKGTSDNLVVVHSTRDYGVNFMVEWDSRKKSQRWTCYTLDKSNSVKNVSRWYAGNGESQYPWDPDIPMSATLGSDPYYSSGYDHGHICPSYDRLNSREANIQTFYQSNMQPQRNKFNAGIWLKMENVISSTWNNNNFRDTLYICKGGTIDNPDQILLTTNKGMIVPKYFFMAVLCKNSQGYKAMGFWVEHLNEDRSQDKLYDYVVSIDELERLTGIDFFCNLPDNVEEATERVVFPASWGLR
jgi:endonuclease G